MTNIKEEPRLLTDMEPEMIEELHSVNKQPKGTTLKPEKDKSPSTDKQMNNRSQIKNGKRLRRKSDPAICPKCKQTFCSSYSLERHYFVHSFSNLFPCFVCTYRFPTLARYKQHMMKHTRKDPQKCIQCSFRDEDPLKLAQHTKVHIVEAKEDIISMCQLALKENCDGKLQHDDRYIE